VYANNGVQVFLRLVATKRRGDMKAVFGSWGLRNARPLALRRKERPPRAPLHEQRKKATLNAAHGRRHTAASAGVSRPTADDRPTDWGSGERVREEVC